jgi:hypothetical protein
LELRNIAACLILSSEKSPPKLGMAQSVLQRFFMQGCQMEAGKTGRKHKVIAPETRKVVFHYRDEGQVEYQRCAEALQQSGINASRSDGRPIYESE